MKYVLDPSLLHDLDRASSLAALVRGPDPWLQACALFAIVATRSKAFAYLVDAALASASTPLVLETANWSLGRLEQA